MGALHALALLVALSFLILERLQLLGLRRHHLNGDLVELGVSYEPVEQALVAHLADVFEQVELLFLLDRLDLVRLEEQVELLLIAVLGLLLLALFFLALLALGLRLGLGCRRGLGPVGALVNLELLLAVVELVEVVALADALVEVGLREPGASVDGAAALDRAVAELSGLLAVDQNVLVVHVVVVVVKSHHATLERRVLKLLHLRFEVRHVNGHARYSHIQTQVHGPVLAGRPRWLGCRHLLRGPRGLSGLQLGNLDAPLKEVRGHDHSVGEQLPEILDPLYALHVLDRVLTRLYVRVPRTRVYLVTYLLAAVAAHVLELLGGVVLGLRVISLVLILLLALMATELAAGGIPSVFATAPPHLAAPVGQMRAA